MLLHLTQLNRILLLMNATTTKNYTFPSLKIFIICGIGYE